MQVIPVARLAEHWDEVVRVLRDGGIIAYPTDTLYGLGASIFSPAGLTQIFTLKDRDSNKPMSIVCADLAETQKYAVVASHVNRLMKEILPGPFTIILAAGSKTPPQVCSEVGKVAIRIPKSEVALGIVRHLGHPITSTSVNKAGCPPLTEPAEIIKQFPDLDIVIDAGSLRGIGSTVIDVTGEELRVVREGAGELRF